MALPNRSARSSFFVGSRNLQSDLVNLATPSLTSQQCDFLAIELGKLHCLSNGSDSLSDDPAVRFVQLVGDAHTTLLREARFYLPETVELVSVSKEEPSLLIAIPRLPLQDQLSTRLFVNMANGFMQNAQNGTPLDSWLKQLRNRFTKVGRPGPNIDGFLRAAYETRRPVLEWVSGQLQIGFGKRATVLEGSITERTPGIGISIAREKSRCNALLSQSGFPVAEGGLAKDLAEARRLTHALGFPVAVKPENLDGGVAVSSDVRSQEELDQAYKVARSASSRVLVEKHIPGKDYRLLFHREHLLVAIERSPGGVSGNGSDTIASLVDQFNRDPDRGLGPETPRYPLEFDQEAELMLRRLDMTAQSIPDKNVFIPLRRAANFARGGSVHRVTADIHPDNLDLALRAMRLLRLDLAGLDLILPDITRSWHETGGAICEINARPFIGDPLNQQIHELILEQMVAGDGRIPIVLLVGKIGQTAIDAISAGVSQLVLVTARGAWLNGRPLSRPGLSWEQACQTALFDPQAAAVLCILDSEEMKIPARSPADRFSAAFLLNIDRPASGQTIPQPLLGLIRRAETNLSAQSEWWPGLQQEGIKYRSLNHESLVDELINALTDLAT